MERADLIFQPRTGTYAQHVHAILMDVPVGNILMMVEDVEKRRCSEQFILEYDHHSKIARGICLAFGVEPDAQPEALIEGALQNDDGYACMETGDGDLAYIVWTLRGGVPANDWHGSEWTNRRLDPTWFENHFLEVGGDE